MVDRGATQLLVGQFVRWQAVLLVAAMFVATAAGIFDATLAAGRGPGVNQVAIVETGAQSLDGADWSLLKGKRVGLIVNHSSRIGDQHLIDILAARPDVELAAIFAPEHGVRGAEEAGAAVSNSRDVRTGVPIYSLYGKTKKPSKRVLANIDILVFDMQDVGVRFYTYGSTMGLAMQAAAANGVPFVVLDRPNPLGGEYVSGFVMEPKAKSFVGLYPIPIAHGLTLGELAQMIRGERYLGGLDGLELHVVRMRGWKRWMLWPQTGFEWRPPSPNIVDFGTALIYPGTGLFEATTASEGRGTMEPFSRIGAPWANERVLARQLNATGLPGVTFERTRFVPKSIRGMAGKPKHRGVRVGGVHLNITDMAAYQPVETGIHVLQAFFNAARQVRGRKFIKSADWLMKLSGTPALRRQLNRRVPADRIIASWQADVAAFVGKRKRYLLY